MIDRYAGWKSLLAEANALGEKFGAEVYTQPKEGYLRITTSASEPADLIRLLDEIEQRSSDTCQFCGRLGAVERQHQEWGYNVCPSSDWVHLLGGGVAASCSF